MFDCVCVCPLAYWHTHCTIIVSTAPPFLWVCSSSFFPSFPSSSPSTLYVSPSLSFYFSPLHPKTHFIFCLPPHSFPYLGLRYLLVLVATLCRPPALRMCVWVRVCYTALLYVSSLCLPALQRRRHRPRGNNLSVCKPLSPSLSLSFSLFFHLKSWITWDAIWVGLARRVLWVLLCSHQHDIQNTLKHFYVQMDDIYQTGFILYWLIINWKQRLKVLIYI